MKLEPLQKDFYYHIYNRGINGETIFVEDENKRYFLELVKKHLKDKITIFAYCLLGNHFHFVVKINDEGKEVTQKLSNLFNSYAKAFNKRYSRTGSLFEKHFKRIILRDEIYLKRLVIYVHLNPQHHFNQNFEKFEFSSYKSYFSPENSLVETSFIIGLFDDLENFIFMHKGKGDSITSKYALE